MREGPAFGYFVNGEKTWLVTKEEHFEEAQEIFHGTGVNITVSGKRHIGAAVGTHEFVTEYVSHQVTGWVEQINRLSDIAKSQPQSAYAAFRRSLSGRWTYFSRVAPGIAELLQPVEEAIRQRFIPSLTGQSVAGKLERDLFVCSTNSTWRSRPT